MWTVLLILAFLVFLVWLFLRKPKTLRQAFDEVKAADQAVSQKAKGDSSGSA